MIKDTIKPSDYNIPEGYSHWVGDKAEDSLGPFFFRNDGGVVTTAMRVEARHINAHDTLHGGIMMAFADYTLCLGGNQGTQTSVVTVTCNNDFMAPAHAGDLVIGESEVTREGRSLVFVRCLLKVGDTPILSSSGVVKLFRDK